MGNKWTIVKAIFRGGRRFVHDNSPAVLSSKVTNYSAGCAVRVASRMSDPISAAFNRNVVPALLATFSSSPIQSHLPYLARPARCPALALPTSFDIFDVIQKTERALASADTRHTRRMLYLENRVLRLNVQQMKAVNPAAASLLVTNPLQCSIRFRSSHMANIIVAPDFNPSSCATCITSSHDRC